MVFVLQNSQNRDGRALQAKLDELILTSQAQNSFIGIEKLDEEQLRRMSRKLAEKATSVETPLPPRPGCSSVTRSPPSLKASDSHDDHPKLAAFQID